MIFPRLTERGKTEKRARSLLCTEKAQTEIFVSLRFVFYS